MQEEPVLVEIKNCRLALGRANDETILFELDSLQIQKAEQVALIGPSGCGKSTLLNLIAGLLRADQGEIRINGQDISSLSNAKMDAFRGSNIGIVFQSFNLLSPFSALENVIAGMRFGRNAAGGNRRARAIELLTKVGLKDRLHALPSRMSVGERQRVSIARGIANKPGLLLADEPTGSLDPDTAATVFSLLRDICAEEACALMFITHDPALSAKLPRTVDCNNLVKSIKEVLS